MHFISVYRSIAVFILLLALSSAGFAQSVGSWGNLAVLSPGIGLVVEGDGGKTVKGKFSRATVSSLFLLKDRREIEIRREEVSAVYFTRKSSRAKRAVVGGLAGAGAGLLIGVVTVAATKGDPLIGAGGVLFGIPAGAAIGAVTGGTRKGELVYRR